MSYILIRMRCIDYKHLVNIRPIVKVLGADWKNAKFDLCDLEKYVNSKSWVICNVSSLDVSIIKMY
jgi:hypothetical protein